VKPESLVQELDDGLTKVFVTARQQGNYYSQATK